MRLKSPLQLVKIFVSALANLFSILGNYQYEDSSTRRIDGNGNFNRQNIYAIEIVQRIVEV